MGDAGKYIGVVVRGTGSYVGTVRSSVTVAVAPATYAITTNTTAKPTGVTEGTNAVSIARYSTVSAANAAAGTGTTSFTSGDTLADGTYYFYFEGAVTGDTTDATANGNYKAAKTVTVSGATQTVTVAAGDWNKIAAPVVATASTITRGIMNPTVTVTGSNFAAGITASDLNVGVGTTGLTIGTVTYVSATQITVAFTGTAAAGDVTIQAKASGFSPVGSSASNTLTVTVPAATHTGVLDNLGASVNLEGTLNIALADLDLSTSVTPTVKVTSGTDTTGKDVTLTWNATTSKFEGTITVSASAGAGKVQATSGETITVTYNDAANASGSAADITKTTSVAAAISGYYTDNNGTDTSLVTTDTVANGTIEATALAGLSTAGYAKLSDGSYVPVTIAWAFDAAYIGTNAEAKAVTGTVSGTFAGGQIPTNRTGTVTVAPTVPTVVTLGEGSLGTAGDKKITGLMGIISYNVSVDGAAVQIMTATFMGELTGLDNTKTYVVKEL